jgi:hypothetical protein
LLLGLVIGWYVQQRHTERETTDVVDQMQQPIESSDREKAVRAIRAIEMIQSGDSRNAVQLLSRPIADFYHFHVRLAHNNERTKDLLIRIEQLANTNPVVASEITNEIQ